MEVKVAPSILSADFSCLGKAVTAMKEWGADMVHIDVMDGHFVPPITIGPIGVEALRPLTDCPFDVHLMVDNPMDQVDAFIKAGADSITIHAEVLPELGQAIRYIKDKGKRAALSLSPDTPLHVLENVLPALDMVLIMTVHPGYGGQAFIPEMLLKISELRKWMDRLGLSTDIEVDGGIYPDNVQSVIDAGANIIVAGSAVFGSEDPVGAIRLLRGSRA